jgi:hypothetical protein
MRKVLVPIIALLALSGCDNPDEFQHPENPKKEISVTPSVTTPTSTETTTTVTTPTDATTPAAPVGKPLAKDTSEAKSGDASVSGTFDKVRVAAALETEIVVGGEPKVTVDCSKNSFDKIKFEIKDGTLNIETKDDFSAETAKISIAMPSLVALSTEKTSLVKITGITGTDFACSASGQSSVDGAGNVDNVVISSDQNCLVKMKNVNSKNATVTANGRTAVEVRCSDSVTATAGGEAVITVYGMPRKVTKNKTEKSIINLAP